MGMHVGVCVPVPGCDTQPSVLAASTKLGKEDLRMERENLRLTL